MNSDKRTKINRLLSLWPQGTVATLKWLKQNGFYQQLISKYKNSGWIKSIGHGAFSRMDEKVDWFGAVYAIQTQLKLPIHIGAKTSLQLQGYAHSLPLGKEYNIYLFGLPSIKLPLWFKKYNWEVNVNYITTNILSNNYFLGLTEKDMRDYKITLSSPEKAIMEVLYLIPEKESFEEAKNLMEGLTTLRPQIIQSLLEECKSIKVKRMFLFLAEYCNHQWLKKIDKSKINLGVGKRMLVKDGMYYPKYKITIPKNLFNEDNL